MYRPHPWGLLVTFIELIKGEEYNFWEHRYTPIYSTNLNWLLLSKNIKFKESDTSFKYVKIFHKLLVKGDILIYSRTRLVRTRDTTYFGLVRTHFSEPEFIYYIDSYVISIRLVRTYG